VTQPDRFISLGRTCEVAFHIRRRLGLERAYPFDWWITPLSAIAPLLRSGFDLDISRDNLMVPDERNTVINKRGRSGIITTSRARAARSFPTGRATSTRCARNTSAAAPGFSKR